MVPGVALAEDCSTSVLSSPPLEAILDSLVFLKAPPTELEPTPLAELLSLVAKLALFRVALLRPQLRVQETPW